MVSSGAMSIALIPSESRETKLEMTRMDGVRVERAGELKQRLRWRQRVRQNEKGLDKENNNSARTSRFFVHFLAVVAQLRRESA